MFANFLSALVALPDRERGGFIFLTLALTALMLLLISKTVATGLPHIKLFVHFCLIMLVYLTIAHIGFRWYFILVYGEKAGEEYGKMPSLL
jgi:hypothetical protein